MTIPRPSELPDDGARDFNDFEDSQVVAILIAGAEWEPIVPGSYRQEVIRFSETYLRLVVFADTEYNREKLFVFAENVVGLKYLEVEDLQTRVSHMGDERTLP